jgi:hypothetical protein
MARTTSVVPLAVACVAAATVLAACSGSSTSSETASAGTTALPSVSASASVPAASPSSEPTTPVIGGDPGTWSPVEITQDMNGQKVKIVVGQAAYFSDLPANDATNKIVLRAKPKGIVKVSQQGTKNGVEQAAGFVGLTKGKTTVTVYDGKPKDPNTQVVEVIKVKVKKAPVATPIASPEASAEASTTS